jgi:hypothetical protein
MDALGPSLELGDCSCIWPYHGLARPAVVSFVLPGRVGLH